MIYSALQGPCLLAFQLAAITAVAFDPNTIGVIQENTYQVDHNQRLLYFFVITGIVAGLGVFFMLIVFGCDALEKARTRRVDHEKYLSRIKNFEDAKVGEVNPDETVFDFHYYPSSVRPDYVVTDEMASVTDATIERIRRQATQRRKLENATRFVAHSARTQIKLNTGLSFLNPTQSPLGEAADAKAGRKENAKAQSGTTAAAASGAAGRTSSGSHGRVGTPLHSHVAAGLTNSGQSQLNVQGPNPFSSALGERTLEDPDYFGFEDDLDFELQ